MRRNSRLQRAWAWSRRWFKRFAAAGVVFVAANLLLGERPVTLEEAMGLYTYPPWPSSDREYIQLSINGTCDHCFQCDGEWFCYRTWFKPYGYDHDPGLEFGPTLPSLEEDRPLCPCNRNCLPDKRNHQSTGRWYFFGLPRLIGGHFVLIPKSIFHDSLDEVVPEEVLERDLYEGSWRRFVAGEQRRCDAP
jgi:hypothetical protein